MATPEEIIVQTLRQRKSPEQEVFDKNRQADGFNAIPDRPYLESFVNALNNPAGEFFGGGLKNLADKWSWDQKGDYGDFAMAALDVPVQGFIQKATLPFVTAGAWLLKNMGREGGESVMKHLGKQSGRLGSEGLPMDQASRMARAEEMGFGDDVYYHASLQDIDEFKPAYDDGLTFLTPSAEFANNWLGKGKYNQRLGETDWFDDFSQAKKELMKSDKFKILNEIPFEESQVTHADLWDEWENATKALREQYRAKNQTIYPVRTNTQNTFVPDDNPEIVQEIMDLFGQGYKGNGATMPQDMVDAFNKGHYMPYENQAVINYLRDKGYDSIKLRESSADFDKPHSTFGVFSPKNIRSINAEFDPSKINSSDILAAALRQQQNYV